MSVACAPDMFQSLMMGLLGYLDFVLCYINNVLILRRARETENKHLNNVKQVLTLLQETEFRGNSRKTFLCRKPSISWGTS